MRSDEKEPIRNRYLVIIDLLDHWTKKAYSGRKFQTQLSEESNCT